MARIRPPGMIGRGRIRLPSATAAPAFTPTSLATVGWWEADGTLWQDSARTTPATANNDPVGAVDDASGTGNHLVQATAGLRPLLKTGILGGKPVIRGDNVNDVLAKTLVASVSQPHTWILVFDVGRPVENNLGGARQIVGSSNGAPSYVYAGSLVTAGPNLAAGTFHIIAVTMNGASSKFWSGGGAATTVNPGTGGVAALSVWYDGTIGGDFAAIGLCPGALTTTQLDQMGNHLAAKYGLTWAAAS